MKSSLPIKGKPFVRLFFAQNIGKTEWPFDRLWVDKEGGYELDYWYAKSH